MVLVIVPPGKTIDRRPYVYLVFTYVKGSKYLGHIINESFNDYGDIECERRNLAVRGNILIR